MQDLFSARICAVLANSNRSKSTDRVWSVNDFMALKLPETPRQIGPQTEAELLQQFEFLNAIFGGEDLR